jgi:hypothetical protein
MAVVLARTIARTGVEEAVAGAIAALLLLLLILLMLLLLMLFLLSYSCLMLAATTSPPPPPLPPLAAHFLGLAVAAVASTVAAPAFAATLAPAQLLLHMPCDMGTCGISALVAAITDCFI